LALVGYVVELTVGGYVATPAARQGSAQGG
jgi:hypothetical protein